MKNSSNFLSSKVWKTWTVLFAAGSIWIMQGCASTNNKVNNLIYDDEFSSWNSALSSQNHEAIMSWEHWRINFSTNPNSRSWSVTMTSDDSSLEFWLQHSERMWLITSAEYSKVNDKWWTLITARVWDEFKSYLVTWLYKWVDYSVKATAGYLNQELEWEDIWQKYLWTEFLKDFSDIVSNFRAGWYVNATSTDSATLNVEEVRSQVDWGTQVVTTTEKFEWQDTYSYWLTAEYDIWSSSFDANFGYSDIGWDWLNYGVGYSYNWEKVRPSLEYSRIEGPDFTSDMYRWRVDYIIQDNVSVWVSYERVENSNNYEDNRYMVNLTYTPGLKTYRRDSREYNHMSLDHATWANQAMSTLYWQRETTTTTEFILDKSRLEQVIAEAESLDSNDFTPSSWNVLSSALNQAKNINNQEEPSTNDLEIVFQNLNSAIEQLQERADKTELISLLNQAESLNSVNYTQDSFQFLQSTINASRTVLEDWNTSQNEVTQAVNNLENWIDNLELQEAPTRPTFSWNTDLTVGDTMNLKFSSTDANGDNLTYRVVWWNIPSWTSFNSDGTLTWTTNNVETWTFEVVANDWRLDSPAVTVNYDIDSVTVTPTPNPTPSPTQPPIISF